MASSKPPARERAEPATHTKVPAAACVLCRGTRQRRFSRWVTPRVVRCEGCGLVYVHPLPTPVSIHAHYNGGHSSRLQYYLDAEPADRRTIGEFLNRVARRLPADARVLDIGPNIGTALAMAAERGWHTRGIEINENAARYCREERGLDVVAGGLESTRPGGETFDLILMLDVIEHLRDPVRDMQRVRDLLAPGGVVIISTPDIARLATCALQIKPEEHLLYFTETTLGLLLRAAGLQVETLESLDRHRNLTAMGESTTLRSPLAPLRPLVRASQRVLGDLIVRLPLRENLLAFATRTWPR